MASLFLEIIKKKKFNSFSRYESFSFNHYVQKSRFDSYVFVVVVVVVIIVYNIYSRLIKSNHAIKFKSNKNF